MSSAIEFARIRLVFEVQYVLRIGRDGVPGDLETWPAWEGYKLSRGVTSRSFRGTSDDRDEDFARDVQAFLGVDPDGEPFALTWGAWVRHAYPEIIAAAVHPLPLYHGAKPVMSSGFNGPGNLGPNRSRWFDLAKKMWGHLGGDYEYYWNEEGDPPAGWLKYHFARRAERRFYGPPVGVMAMLPGVVEDVSLTDYDDGTTEDDRYTVKIYHGQWPNMGHLVSRSTHHMKALVKNGDKVEATTQIAVMGDRGAEGAPHNHQEFWRWQDGELVSHFSEAAFDLVPLVSQFRLHDPDAEEKPDLKMGHCAPCAGRPSRSVLQLDE